MTVNDRVVIFRYILEEEKSSMIFRRYNDFQDIYYFNWIYIYANDHNNLRFSRIILRYHHDLNYLTEYCVPIESIF